MKSRKLHLLLLTIITLLFSSCLTQKVETGYDVFKLMHDKYNGKWVKNLTFTQETNFINNNEIENTEIWEEAYSAPGNFIVKFNGFESGDGLIFKEKNLYKFEENIHTSTKQEEHELILLGFDIYHQDVIQSTISLLGLDYNLDKVYDTIWNNRPVYIIGESHSHINYKQIIIDKKELYFLANIKVIDKIKYESRFLNYKKINGKLIATQVEFFKNDDLYLREIYSNIKTPGNIDKSIFDPQNFSTSVW